MNERCHFRDCDFTVQYRIRRPDGTERRYCEWHAVGYYRETVAPAFKSPLHSARASASVDRMSDADIDREHEFWRDRFLKNLGKPFQAPERKPEPF